MSTNQTAYDYEIVLLVTTGLLGAVIEAVAPQCKVERVTSLQKEEEKEKKERAPHAFVGGKRLKGIRGRDLLLEILADGKWHFRETVSAVFAQRGFSPQSFSPAASELKKEGKIVTLPGRYRLAPMGVANNSAVDGV